MSDQGGYIKFRRRQYGFPLLTVSFVVNVGQEEVLSGKVRVPEEMSEDVPRAQDYVRGEIYKLLATKRILGQTEIRLTIFSFGEYHSLEDF